MGPRLLDEGTRKGLLPIAIFWASRLELINLRKAPVCGHLLRCDQADHRMLSTQKTPPGRRCNEGARWRGCLYWREALRGLCECTHCLLLGLECGRCLWMAAPFVRGSSKLGLVWPRSPLPANAQLRSKCRDGGNLCSPIFCFIYWDLLRSCETVLSPSPAKVPVLAGLQQSALLSSIGQLGGDHGEGWPPRLRAWRSNLLCVSEWQGSASQGFPRYYHRPLE